MSDAIQVQQHTERGGYRPWLPIDHPDVPLAVADAARSVAGGGVWMSRFTVYGQTWFARNGVAVSPPPTPQP
jgi:hypothetical protein